MAKPKQTIAFTQAFTNCYACYSDLKPEQLYEVKGVILVTSTRYGYNYIYLDPRYDADEVLAEITALAEGNDAWVDAVGDLPLDE